MVRHLITVRDWDALALLREGFQIQCQALPKSWHCQNWLTPPAPWAVVVLFVWILIPVNVNYHWSSGGAFSKGFTNLVGCKYTAALMRGGWAGNSVQTVFNWMNLANPSGHVNANQVFMLYFSISTIIKHPICAILPIAPHHPWRRGLVIFISILTSNSM